MNLITAKEARELSAVPTEEMIIEINKMIVSAANKGERKIRIPYEYCEFKGYSAKFKRPEVEKALVNVGYNVYTQSEERQFVDVWIEVSW